MCGGARASSRPMKGPSLLRPGGGKQALTALARDVADLSPVLRLHTHVGTDPAWRGAAWTPTSRVRLAMCGPPSCGLLPLWAGSFLSRYSLEPCTRHLSHGGHAWLEGAEQVLWMGAASNTQAGSRLPAAALTRCPPWNVGCRGCRVLHGSLGQGGAVLLWLCPL